MDLKISSQLEDFLKRYEFLEAKLMDQDILNKSVLPVIIRADYNRDPEESELHHPYSHITLGGYKNCRIPVDRPISPMKFVKFIMEHFYYVPSSQLEFNFEIEGIVAFEEHIAEKDINKSRIIV